MSKTTRLMYIAMLAAQAVVIAIFERFIPAFFAFAPGAKLGLANIITIVAIFTLPIKDSFKVVVLRLLLATLLTGTLSTFLYSLAGSTLSYFGMLIVRALGPKRVSVVGISTVGGMLHNVGQLLVASFIAQSSAVMLYLPILSFSGILAGVATGMAGNFMLEHISAVKLFFKDESKRSKLSNAWYKASLNKELHVNDKRIQER